MINRLKIYRHVFGSQRGYTTLARSPGVNDTNSRELESVIFSFGQTDNPQYSQSLKQSPAFFTLELSGSRRCLTRVLPGQADESGRATLLFVSAILSRIQWDEQLLGQIDWLLVNQSLWEWDGNTVLSLADLAQPPPPRTISRATAEKLLSLISEVELRQSAGQRTVVSASEFGRDEISALETLFPPSSRVAVSIAFRSLNPQFLATVNAIAAEASSQSVTFRRTSLPRPVSPYAAALKRAGFSTGMIPLDTIAAYRQFGEEALPPVPTKAVAPAQKSSATAVDESGAVIPFLLIALLGVVAAVVCYFVGRAQERQDIHNLEQRITQSQSQAINQSKQQIESLYDAVGQANVKLEVIRKKTDALEIRLGNQQPSTEGKSTKAMKDHNAATSAPTTRPGKKSSKEGGK